MAATRILIVDDEPHVRTYLKLLVNQLLLQAEVLQAGDEATAVRIFTEAKPDLVLLDINLIGSSGLDVLVSLRRLDAAATIVMLTAVNVRHTIDEALANGANGYILKDTNDEEMSNALREILQDINEGAAPSAP